MSSPAPTPLGNCHTTAIAAPSGHAFKEQLDALGKSRRCPVIIHGATGEARELALATRESLELHGWTTAWGLGGVCADMEQVASFATAGYTWFQFALTSHLDLRVDTMTLDELDARIVELEDGGCYAPEWHAHYLSDGANPACSSQYRFTDEALARAAVKFGPALTHAGELHDALRTLWCGRDNLPDIEATVAASAAPTTPAELVFLSRELLQRGIGSAHHLRVTPSFGSVCEPGCVLEEEPSISPDDCASGVIFTAPAQLAFKCGWEHAHHDDCDASILAALKIAATRDPSLFREWVGAASDAFPSSRGGRTYRLTDDDVRFIPHSDDAELASTFLDHWQGRQLLLVTWNEVERKLGARLNALLA